MKAVSPENATRKSHVTASHGLHNLGNIRLHNVEKRNIIKTYAKYVPVDGFRAAAVDSSSEGTVVGDEICR